jgi:hypothetical protein
MMTASSRVPRCISVLRDLRPWDTTISQWSLPRPFLSLIDTEAPGDLGTEVDDGSGRHLPDPEVLQQQVQFAVEILNLFF